MSVLSRSSFEKVKKPMTDQDNTNIMQFSQSRLNSRGPLIAVIKIELDATSFDRIFLHQNDDDYRLAEDFQRKHALDSALVPHIYQRINLSRMAVTSSQAQQTKLTPSHNGYDSTHNHEDQLPSFTQFQQTPIKSDYAKPPQQHFDRQFNNPTEGPRSDHKTQYGITHFREVAERREELLFGAPRKQTDHFPGLQQTNDRIGTLLHQISPGSIEPSNTTFQSETMEDRELFEARTNSEHITPTIKPQLKHISQTQKESLRMQRTHQSPFSQNKNSTGKIYVKPQSKPKQWNKPQSHIHPRSQQPEDDSFIKPQPMKILNQDQLLQMQTPMRRSMSKKEINQVNRDVTNRLYNEADIKRKYLNKIKEKARNDHSESQEKELTCKPVINKISKVIAQDRKNNKTLEDHLFEEGRKMQIKREESKSKLTHKEQQQCSFQPSINAISSQLVTDRSKHSYVQSKSKKQQVIDRNSFRPKINEKSDRIAKQKGSFETRLKKFNEAKNNNLIQRIQQNRIKDKIDPSSGQELFKPTILEKKGREDQGGNIGNYLYDMSKLDKEVPMEEYRVKVNENSEAIIEQMHLKRIAWLFSELDSDQDGVISSQKICIESIDEKLLEVIMPVLFELEQMDTQLNLNDFRRAIHNLHGSICPVDKSVLYNYPQKAVK